jgi:hypothetical protein
MRIMSRSGSYAKFSLYHYKLGYVIIKSYNQGQASNNPIKLYDNRESAEKVTEKEGTFFVGDENYNFSDLEVDRIYFDWNSAGSRKP